MTAGSTPATAIARTLTSGVNHTPAAFGHKAGGCPGIEWTTVAGIYAPPSGMKAGFSVPSFESCRGECAGPRA